MVPRKTWVSENFGPMSKSRKRFLWVSKSRFRAIFASWVLDFFFLPKDLGVSDSSFFISVWSSGVEINQRSLYSLSN